MLESAHCSLVKRGRPQSESGLPEQFSGRNQKRMTVGGFLRGGEFGVHLLDFFVSSLVSRKARKGRQRGEAVENGKAGENDESPVKSRVSANP